jgi:hypothetical protein
MPVILPGHRHSAERARTKAAQDLAHDQALQRQADHVLYIQMEIFETAQWLIWLS